MIIALLKELTPPPRPSICLPFGSGEPSAVRMILSRAAGENGARCSALNIKPLLVPPRQNELATGRGGIFDQEAKSSPRNRAALPLNLRAAFIYFGNFSVPSDTFQKVLAG